MAVTRSTPAERRRAAATVPARASRGREAALLAGALAAVVLGLGLVYGALSRPFPDVEARLGRGELLNLNAAPRREALLPLLSFAAEPAERAFLADRLWQRLSRPGEAPVENVGELAKIRVEASEVLGNPKLAGLRARLGDRKEGTVALLALSELRQLKPTAVVRTPREFRRLFWAWSALFLLGFAAVHAGFRWTGFRGDELVLPILFTLTGVGLALMLAIVLHWRADLWHLHAPANAK